jgi:hypothetical protein
MLRQAKQIKLSLMLSMGLAGGLCAQQGITAGEAARLQRQFSAEIRGLERQMEMEALERKHVVKDPSVVEGEIRTQQAAKRIEHKSTRKQNVNPRSPQQKAEIDQALKAFNGRLPEINASLSQASSNSTLPKVVLKPMTSEGVLASSGGKGMSGRTAEQQAVNQMINKRIQDEMKKMDPETRKQMERVLKAAEQGKPIPLPPGMPPVQRTQLLPKGTL